MADGAIRGPQSRYRPFHRLTFQRSAQEKFTALLEELFIYLLDVQGLLHPAANAMADHHAGELIAVDEHDPLVQCSAV
jgi:hypothetical protein